VSGEGTPGRPGGFRSIFRRLYRRAEMVDPLPPAAPPAGTAAISGAAAAAPLPPSVDPAHRLPPEAGARFGSCPSCRVPFLPGGVAGQTSCPMCGRHGPRLTRAPPTTGAAPPNPAAPVAGRHEQELLAAWMSGGRMACAQCRGLLRQLRPGEFVCRACGTPAYVRELDPRSRRAAELPAEAPAADGLGHPVDVPGQGAVGGEGSDQGAQRP
jgi:uncharacterized Zn finger protein (UPF0148 family)